LLPLASPPEVHQNRSWSGCPSASRILADVLDLNGVGDFGELLIHLDGVLRNHPLAPT
jgi:hypothetical protein